MATATVTSTAICSAVIARGAPATRSTTTPVATESAARPSGTARCSRSRRWWSVYRPLRTPRSTMNAGIATVNSIPTSDHATPTTPTARAPTTG